jgi:hypothetical protein
MANLHASLLTLALTVFLIVVHRSHGLNNEPPILNCHINRTVTVDISSADSAWNYVHVETDKGKPICRSDFNKEGLSFDIDKECQIEAEENTTHRIFRIEIRAREQLLFETADDKTFVYNCTDPLFYSGPDRGSAPIFGDGRYIIEPGSSAALSSQSTTILIIVVAVALFILVALIVAIVCVTCDCFGKRRYRHRSRLRRNRKPRDALTRY